jgi:hypothetical protein
MEEVQELVIFSMLSVRTKNFIFFRISWNCNRLLCWKKECCMALALAAQKRLKRDETLVGTNVTDSVRPFHRSMKDFFPSLKKKESIQQLLDELIRSCCLPC